METVEAQKKKKKKKKGKEKEFRKMEGHGGSALWNSTGWKRDAPRSIPMFPTFFVHPRGDVLIRRVQSTGSLRFHWTLTFYAHLIPSFSTLFPPLPPSLSSTVSIIHCFQVKTTSSTIVVSGNKNLFSNFLLLSFYLLFSIIVPCIFRWLFHFLNNSNFIFERKKKQRKLDFKPPVRVLFVTRCFCLRNKIKKKIVYKGSLYIH